MYKINALFPNVRPKTHSFPAAAIHVIAHSTIVLVASFLTALSIALMSTFFFVHTCITAFSKTLHLPLMKETF